MDESERGDGEDGGPKRKKPKGNSYHRTHMENMDTSVRKEAYKVFISFVNEAESFAGWSPIHLTRQVHQELGDVVRASKTRAGALLVECVDEQQHLKALNLTTFGGQNVKCVAGRDKELIRGVITGIPVGDTVEDLLASIRNVKVKEAKRLKMKRDGVLSDSLSVLLTFDEFRLPPKVYIGFMCYDVRVYIPPPLRCFKCQRYGHVAAVCKGKTRCSKCGGEHSYGECAEGVTQKCCNCGGNHSAAYGGCEVFKRMREVQRVKVEQGTSYAEALKRVPRPILTPSPSVPTRKETECTSCKKIEDDSLIVKKLDFVLFMTDVINGTAQYKSRTDRIKIIVKSAKRFLNIDGLEWEAVVEGLKEPAGSEVNASQSSCLDELVQF